MGAMKGTDRFFQSKNLFGTFEEGLSVVGIVALSVLHSKSGWPAAGGLSRDVGGASVAHALLMEVNLSSRLLMEALKEDAMGDAPARAPHHQE